MKILICADHSAAGEHVLQEAQKFLTPFKEVDLYVYSVIDMAIVSVAGMYNNSEMIGLLEKEAEQVKEWAKKIFAGRDIRFSSEVGYPATMVMQKVKDEKIDLLIMGTHGKTGLNRILIGSVAENVLRHTSCNTLIIPVKNLN